MVEEESLNLFLVWVRIPAQVHATSPTVEATVSKAVK